jgi:hypothetical protein
MVKSGLKPHIVIFVEGDTDKIFFDALLNFYRSHSATPLHSCEVRNLKGVSRYTSKVTGKLQNEICPNANKKGLEVKAVCCSYDTDVFEFAERPVVDWGKVEREVKRLGIEEFCQIRVKSMIEDWLLDDMDGICRYLRLSPVQKLVGTSGYVKIQQLFKCANKVYLKGISIKAFIDDIDLAIIQNHRKQMLMELERLLNVSI